MKTFLRYFFWIWVGFALFWYAADEPGKPPFLTFSEMTLTCVVATLMVVGVLRLIHGPRTPPQYDGPEMGDPGTMPVVPRPPASDSSETGGLEDGPYLPVE